MPALATISAGSPFLQSTLDKIAACHPSPEQIQDLTHKVAERLAKAQAADQGPPVVNAAAGPPHAAAGSASPGKDLDGPRGELPDPNATAGPSNKASGAGAPTRKKPTTRHTKASPTTAVPRDQVRKSDLRFSFDEGFKAQAEEEERRRFKEGQEAADHERRRIQRVILKVWMQDGKAPKLLEHSQYVHPHIPLTGNLRHAAGLDGPMPVAQWKKVDADTWGWTTLVDDVPVLEVEDGIRTFYLRRDDVTDIVDPPSGHNAPQPDRRQVQGPSSISQARAAAAQASRNLVRNRAYMRQTPQPAKTKPVHVARTTHVPLEPTPPPAKIPVRLHPKAQDKGKARAEAPPPGRGWSQNSYGQSGSESEGTSGSPDIVELSEETWNLPKPVRRPPKHRLSTVPEDQHRVPHPHDRLQLPRCTRCGRPTPAWEEQSKDVLPYLVEGQYFHPDGKECLPRDAHAGPSHQDLPMEHDIDGEGDDFSDNGGGASPALTSNSGESSSSVEIISEGLWQPPRMWPRHYHFVDVDAVWSTLSPRSEWEPGATRTLKDNVLAKRFKDMTGVRWISSTYYDHHKVWRQMPEEEQERYRSYGRTPLGEWGKYSKGKVRAQKKTGGASGRGTLPPESGP